MLGLNDPFFPQRLARGKRFFQKGQTMKRDVYDNRVSEAIDEIYRDMNPKPSRWHLIGYRQGRKVFMTESALRRCDIDEVCSDPLLRPARQHRSRGYRPNPQPPLSDSMWFELVCWLGQSLLEIFAGQRS